LAWVLLLPKRRSLFVSVLLAVWNFFDYLFGSSQKSPLPHCGREFIFKWKRTKGKISRVFRQKVQIIETKLFQTVQSWYAKEEKQNGVHGGHRWRAKFETLPIKQHRKGKVRFHVLCRRKYDTKLDLFLAGGNWNLSGLGEPCRREFVDMRRPKFCGALKGQITGQISISGQKLSKA
jgi:hypothetical protein